MARQHNLHDLLSIGDVRYVLVRPHRGMRYGFEVINGFNEKQLGEASDFEEAVEKAHELVETSPSFERVLAVHPEKE